VKNSDGSVRLPVTGDSIDWNRIPDFRPPPDFQVSDAQFGPTVDMFFEGCNEDKFDRLTEWIPSCGCVSVEEFLLKSETMYGCGEEWFKMAVENGYPLVKYLEDYPNIVVEMLDKTRIFDCAVQTKDFAGYNNYIGFWNFYSMISSCSGAVNSPEWTFKILSAYFAKLFDIRYT
jgi:hypothetical protein